MFGYAVPLYLSLSPQDASAYRGYYCETCHQLRDGYGVMSTIAVSYEMTFASILLDSISFNKHIVSPKAGPLCVFRHSDSDSEIMKKLAGYTVLVTYNGLLDHKLDSPSLKSNLGLLWMNKAIEKAKKNYPDYIELILKGYSDLREKEANGCSDALEMGYTSAKSMIDVLQLMNGNSWTPALKKMFQNLGAWVYIMDAIDDLNDDWKNNQYNPFLVSVDSFKNSRDFVTSNVYQISECVGKAVGGIQSAYAEFRKTMNCNVSLCDNIVYQGIPATVRAVMDGRSRSKPTLTDMCGNRMNRAIGSEF